MKNFVQQGNNITAVAPSGGVQSGDPVLIGKLFGVAAVNGLEGDLVELAVTGVFALPKTSPALATGAIAYVTGSGSISGTASGNTRIGIVVSDAAENEATVRIRLDGAAT